MASNGGSGADYQAVEANETRRKRINQVAPRIPFFVCVESTNTARNSWTFKPIISWPRKTDPFPLVVEPPRSAMVHPSDPCS